LKKYRNDPEKARAEFNGRSKDCVPPLPSKEIDAIWASAIKRASEDPGASWRDENGKLLKAEFCEMLKREMRLKKIDGALYAYNPENGEYERGGTAAEGKITEFMYKKIPILTIRQASEIFHCLTNTIYENGRRAGNEYMILFANGIFDINTDKLLPFSPDYVIRNRIPIRYNPNAYAPIVNKFLRDITMNDESMILVLFEGLGASMYRGVFGKAYWLSGNGRNGKSVFLGAVEEILTDKNCSHVPMEYWSEKFKNAPLEGKTANICHEAGSEHIKDTTYIKACIRGERIDIEQKKTTDAHNHTVLHVMDGIKRNASNRIFAKPRRNRKSFFDNTV
jgi:putative DNA primase/helicase